MGTAIPRKTAVIFGNAAPATTAAGIGEFGSLALGTPTLSTDIAVIMAQGAWSTGWSAAWVGNFPALNDENAVDYVHSTQIAYLLQRGIPEYDAATTYYTGCFCSFNSTVYVSTANNNTGNTPNTSPTKWAIGIGTQETFVGTTDL